jgi:hypothetical protein
VLDAPVSALKLWGRKKNPAKGENREAVRRYILQCWLQIDGPRLWTEECQREPDPKRRRRVMLVITQKKFRRWLEGRLLKVSKPTALPEGIALEHYNNISGLDRYKDVAGLMLVGRIQPSPDDIEAYAGALTGVEPIKMPAAAPGQPRQWYRPIERAIRMADGSGVQVERCDLHPDPMGEAVRQMLCESEALQAVGRARAINRDTPERALKVWIVNNVVLDLTVNAVSQWQEPNQLVEPLALDGLILTAPGDMAKGWPNIWPTTDTAKWTLKKLQETARRGGAGFRSGISSVYLILEIPLRNHLAAVQYQARRGRGQRLREAFFDLRVWSHPGAKIIEKIGEAYRAFAHKLYSPDIEPLVGNGKVTIDDTRVWTLVRETLDQLFDRAAKYPWRKLPEQQPSQQFVCDDGSQPLPCPQRHNRMRYRTPAERAAERRKREADVADIYAALPIELRLAALCLPPPPENSRRHDGQEAA